MGLQASRLGGSAGAMQEGPRDLLEVLAHLAHRRAGQRGHAQRREKQGAPPLLVGDFDEGGEGTHREAARERALEGGGEQGDREQKERPQALRCLALDQPRTRTL
eukprot:CAMPEP_0172588564 /NCGR_PEP_ID=MMETSP1068-20121228/7459_1 /TAXON_ID=35684 /ORGANISM="Pseudopedinella elastica, Strain CCMP716" /LENGTH=104 /DNA_ID=CAMNT_0013383933 /DNA_START=452 /DNA_END=763 /DNA_ORIENTATION=+